MMQLPDYNIVKVVKNGFIPVKLSGEKQVCLMSIKSLIRKLYIKTTNLTHSYQGKSRKLISFYKLWSLFYDFSVGLDPAFDRQLKNMISATLKSGDTTLDIGCGTGISTLYAAEISKRIVGIDISADMLARLKQKITDKNSNIEVLHGSFPQDLRRDRKFDSIISSFTIVHFTSQQRRDVYREIYNFLKSGGRLGLFAAQGEIAPSFETAKEIQNNLVLAGFTKIEIKDISDIYRIVRAEKP